jgi:formylglycine-generating enzyme required for sulfatase activity
MPIFLICELSKINYARTLIDINLKTNPSRFKGDELPVERVNWCEATEFCKRLSRERKQEYRLPSEAEC